MNLNMNLFHLLYKQEIWRRKDGLNMAHLFIKRYKRFLWRKVPTVKEALQFPKEPTKMHVEPPKKLLRQRGLNGHVKPYN